jgi:hypothetical protein
MAEAKWVERKALDGASSRAIPVFALGMSLAIFFVVSYLARIVLYLVAPDWVLNHAMLSLFLPGFTLLSWPSFLLGLAESFGYGWYVALIIGPIYNYFAMRTH